jgi:outer membrane receptor protein involved in Fe transport
MLCSNIKSGLILTASGIALLAAMHASSAQAQQPPQQSQRRVAIEEIVVTAKQREQNLQEVPLAITVFSSEDLVKRRIVDPRDIASFTPNFNFYAGTGRQDATSMSLRGLSPNTTDERYQGVTFFLDGVPVSGTMTSFTTVNLERVEVIKGPQSATFGRATYSGAIDYVTRTPKSDTLSGSARGQISSGSNTDMSYLVSANASFPILSGRVWGETAVFALRNGALSRDRLTQAEIGREESVGATAVLYAEPNENLSIKFRFMWDRDRDSQPQLVSQHPRQWQQAGTLIRLPSGLFWTTKILDPDPRDAGCDAQGAGNPADCGFERRRQFFSLVGNYQFGEGYTVSYLGGYFRQDLRGNQDAYYRGRRDPLFSDLPIPTKFSSLYFVSPEKFTNTSHQLRIVSPDEERFRWRAGVFYFWELDRLFSRAGGGVVWNPNNPTMQRAGDLWYENYAAFGGVDYDLTTQLTASLELRAERETVAYDACTFCVFVNPIDRREKSTNVLPRATLSYKLTDENSVYALYAYGTRPGRFNETLPPTYFFARKEKLNNFEIGSKNTFLDNRFLLNLAGFYQKVKDQQYRIAEATTAVQRIDNVASSDVWGFEIEAVAQLTEAWSISGGIGYARQRYKSSTDLNRLPFSTNAFFPLGQANLQGFTQINVPAWTGNASTEYVVPLSGEHELALRLDYIFRGSQYVDFGNVAKIPAAHKVNLRATLQTERYRLSAFVNNATNDKTATGSGFGTAGTCLHNAPEFPGAESCGVAGIPRPREYGVEFVVDF